MRIYAIEQLEELRAARGLCEIEIGADGFLSGNLPIYLFKYAIWALENGGSVSVRASKTINFMGIVPGIWSFPFLLQEACKAIEGIGEISEVDFKNRTFRFTRICSPASPGPWSAVVMFSGRESELPLLDLCIKGLLVQPELANGGQIVVCGPGSAKEAIRPYPGVEYLEMETPTLAGRFLVGRKKNLAMATLKHDRILVCHTRIVLEPGCLAKIPYEFEVITPAVWVKGVTGRQLPYLDLFFLKLDMNSLFTNKTPPFLGYSRKKWKYLLRNLQPYIDGGLFCIKKSIAKAIPLSESIAWGEGEDIEWCRRLLQNGKIMELCPEARAQSVTIKTFYYQKWGHFPGYGAITHFLHQIKTLLRRIA